MKQNLSMESVNAMRNASPSRERTPSKQSANAKRSQDATATSSKNNGRDLRNLHPRRNSIRPGSPSRERVPNQGHFMVSASPSRERMSMMNASPPREQVPPMQPGMQQYGFKSPQTYNQAPMHTQSPSSYASQKNSGQDSRNPYPHHNATRSASPSRERMPHQHNATIKASPSRERMQPNQSVVPCVGYKSAPTPVMNQDNAMRNASPSREQMLHMQPVMQHGGYKSNPTQANNQLNATRNASPARERMPSMQSVAQHVRHKASTTPTTNQTPMNAQSPSNYGNLHPPGPNRYPSFNHYAHQQHTPIHDISHCGSLQSNNSFSSASPGFNPPSTRSCQPHPNQLQFQRHNPPPTGANHSSINHISQRQIHHPQKPATPLNGHYAEQPRHPAQNQTPVQGQQFNQMRYQKSYNRY
mmetsp:Transcript_19890/g.35775  ORF Transcript_19890/g.35775 Transcript_19890/m.35775 type:complete len:414 (+) Transcript_19890:3-1244(+)